MRRQILYMAYIEVLSLQKETISGMAHAFNKGPSIL
jgi:hypothetical protein